MKERVAINVTGKTAERRKKLLSKVFDHKVSADVAENKVLDFAEEGLKHGKPVRLQR